MTGARWLAAALTALAAGCASTPPLSTTLPPAAAGVVDITATPFFPQEDHQCGPAALATVLGAAGVAVDPATLAPQVFLPGREGSLQAELVGATRRHDRLPYLLPPRIEALLAELRAGRPVLVLQNLGVASYPVWHYAVLVGYDAARNEVMLRSGRERRQQLGWRRFAGSWDRGGRWSMVALKPGEFPADDDPRRFLETVAGLEATGRAEAAHAAYSAATARWPAQPLAWLGLGNTDHASGRYLSAARSYRRATELDPQDPVARNNLAQALADAGCSALAQAEARRAVALAGDGPFANEARATLAGIGGIADANEDCRTLAATPPVVRP